MNVTVNGQKRKLAWIGTSPKYGMMKVRAPLDLSGLPDQSNNFAVIQPVLGSWIRDQGGIGACVCEATAYLYRWLALKNKLPDLPISVLDLYRLVRIAIGTYPDDSGSTMTDGAWTLHKKGCGADKYWPFVDQEFNTKPPKLCVSDEPNHQATDSFAIPNFQVALSQLAKRGPYMHGVTVCDNWPGIEGNPDDGTGIIPMPTSDSQPIGGHGLMVMDYSKVDRTYTFGPKPITVKGPHIMGPNSWSTGWGYAGFYFMPFDYAGNDNMANERIELLKEIDR